MPDAMVDQVRRFNRMVTESVGALSDHFLGRERPLGEARLLWEMDSTAASCGYCARAWDSTLAISAVCCARLRPPVWSGWRE